MLREAEINAESIKKRGILESKRKISEAEIKSLRKEMAIQEEHHHHQRE